MLVQTVMSLAAPWPLKIILDNVVGTHKLPPGWTTCCASRFSGDAKCRSRSVAAVAVVVDRALGALASYVANYYTESVGQYVAHDLRMRTYHHLQRLSLGYYDTIRSARSSSTITRDVQTIQDFASSGTLGILVDLLTILGMLCIMFWLNWDFALIAVAMTPFLLFLVSRFKKAVKKATHEVRKHQAESSRWCSRDSIDARREGIRHAGPGERTGSK